MLQEKIKAGIKTALKEKKDVQKNILRVALGQIQALEAKQEVKEEHIENILRKIAAANDETMAALKSQGRTDSVNKLLEENEILQSFLPTAWTQEEINKFLNEQDVIQSIGEVFGDD